MPTLDDIAYIYNALPTASIILKGNSPYFTIVTANTAFLKSTNTVLSELVGKNFFDKFPDEFDNKNQGIGSLHTALEQVLKLKSTYQINGYKYPQPSTNQDELQPFFWKIEIYPLPDQFGETDYIVQSWEDITESKKTQDALKSSNELYNYVNKATNDAIYDWDLLQDHLEWGEAFSRVFGYHKNSEKFPIKNWSVMLHPDDLESTNESLTELLKNKDKINWTVEYRLKKANGDYAFVLENGYVLRDEAGTAIRMIGVLHDITQRKESELKIKESLKRYKNYIHIIEQRNLRLRDIAWAQAHLVRPPLARIMGIVQLLYDAQSNADTDEKKLFFYLDISAKELDKIVKDIIDKSRI